MSLAQTHLVGPPIQAANRLSSRFLLAFLLCSSALALDVTKLNRSSYVNDFAHAIDAASAQSLEAYCGFLERSTGAQIAVVTVETLDGGDAASVANGLFSQWGIGSKSTDTGLLLLFAIKDQKDRAEVGYGLEPIITDADAGSILRGIRPILRQHTYGPAILAAVQQLGAKIEAAKAGLPAPRPAGAKPIPYWIVAIGIFLLFSLIGWIANGGGGIKGFFAGYFGNMRGRRSAWAGGPFEDSSGAGGYTGGSGNHSDGGGWGGGGFGGSSGGGGASSGW